MESSSFQLAWPGSPEKKQESKDAQKVMRRLAQRLKPLGFERTKPTYFTRVDEFVVHFVHVHKYTFGRCFRVHLGIRVKRDEAPHSNLNGPISDWLEDGSTGHHQRFDYGPTPESIDACAGTMFSFIEREAVNWFQTFSSPDELLHSLESPLHARDKDCLRQALQNPAGRVPSAATCKELGIE